MKGARVIYKISIPKFEKWNPRKDLKRSTWFRLENNWALRLCQEGLTWSEAGVWPVLLGTISDRSASEFELDVTWLCRTLGFRKATFVSSFNKLKDLGMVDGGPKTLRPRNAKVPLRTNGRTNETDERLNCGALTATTRDVKPKKPVSEKTDGSYIWDAYAAAFEGRYKVPPKRNEKTNSLCKQVAKRLGVDDGVKVAAFYLTHNDAWYVKNTHAMEYLVKNCEGLLTQMQTGNKVTSTQAHQTDRTSANAEVFGKLFDRIKRDEQNKNAINIDPLSGGQE